MEVFLNCLFTNVEGIAAIIAIFIAIWTLNASIKDTKKNQLMEIFISLIELMNTEKDKIDLFNKNIIETNEKKIKENPNYTKEDLRFPTIYLVNAFTASHYYRTEEEKNIVLKALAETTENLSISDINEEYELNYIVFGSYFKIFHRIIKVLNSEYSNKFISEKEYCNYIGILRSQFQNEDFLLLLFNAIISPRGTGMGLELLGSGFFGTKVDIEIKQHFRFDDDLKINNRKLKNILKMFTFEYRGRFVNINKTREQVKNKYEQDSIKQILKESNDELKSFYNYINYIKKLEQ